MQRNEFVLLPPSGMDEVKAGLQEAEDLLNELGKIHSKVIPEASCTAEVFMRDCYGFAVMKILRLLGFEYGHYDEKYHSLTFGGKKDYRVLSDDEVMELNKRWNMKDASHE